MTAPTTRSRRLPWVAILIAFAAVLAALAVGYWFGVGQAPATNSAEVGFARDMAVHHAQAVEMSLLLLDRTTDPAMDQLAVDIMLTQQNQIGRMESWLSLWDEPLLSLEPKMAWMGMPTEGLMPGLATRAQLGELAAAEGGAADVLYMQLMIPHHQSGVAMAQAVLDRSNHPIVRELAQSMITSQSKEIELMQELLQQKGAEPTGDAPAMQMDDHS